MLILKPWTKYCLKNWLSANDKQPYAPENKVKRLLDRCGTLLLRDVPKGNRATLTSYKEMMVGSREINISDCPEGIAQLFEEGMTDIAKATPDDRLRYSVLKEKLDALAGDSVEKDKPCYKKRSTRLDR